MTYLNPVQTVTDLILDLDVPDEQLAEALASRLGDLIGDQEVVDLQ